MSAMSSFALDITIRDLQDADLAGLSWCTSPRDLDVQAAELRAATGPADYLLACVPSGESVGRVRISYDRRPGAGTLWQLDVREPLRSCGIGTALVDASERRIRERGLDRADLAVEEVNPRARALYERLGYIAFDTEPDGWDHELPDGTVTRYETVCVLLRKQLVDLLRS